jgi:hypothetical protein
LKSDCLGTRHEETDEEGRGVEKRGGDEEGEGDEEREEDEEERSSLSSMTVSPSQYCFRSEKVWLQRHVSKFVS